MKGFKCESNVGMFRGADDSASKCILNLLKAKLQLLWRDSVVDCGDSWTVSTISKQTDASWRFQWTTRAHTDVL